MQAFEIGCGLVFAVLCIETFQISFFGLSIGFILLPILHHIRWDTPLLRPLVYLPFSFILIGVALGGMSAAGVQTVLFGFGFHF